MNSQEPPYADTKRLPNPASHTSPKQHIHSILNPEQEETIPESSQGTQPGTYNLTPPPSIPTTQPNASQPDQIVKKRSHEEMREGENPQKEAQVTKQIRRTSSFLRIALSQDGSAKVRREGETTPSPPKARPPPPRKSSMMRSQSDVSFQFRDTTTMKGPPGRSRDARTWEFYCDKSARSSLASRAEEEATGSAAGAIGLMRSGRKQPLASNSTRQNKLRRTPSVLQKPVLSRAHSSMARLQSSDELTAEDELQKQRLGHKRRSSGSDSDKENWVPGTREIGPAQRRPAAENRPILQPPSSAPARPVLPSENDQENKVGTNGKAKTKVDDLDCVQGLLSLSQGAWQ